MKNPRIFWASENYPDGLCQEMTGDFVFDEEVKGFMHCLKCAWGAFTGKYDLMRWRDRKAFTSGIEFDSEHQILGHGTVVVINYRQFGLTHIYSLKELERFGIAIGKRIEYKWGVWEILNIEAAVGPHIKEKIGLVIRKVDK